MSFNVIGVGPGDSELLTVKAVRIIKEADVIIVPVKKADTTDSVALTIAKPYIEDLTKVAYYYFPMFHGFDKDAETLKMFESHGQRINGLIAEGKKVVFLTLGDPSIYSTYAYVNQYVSEVTYVPGIPSFINGAALLGQPLVLGDESLCVLNMTDDEAGIRHKFLCHESIVVMKVSANQKLLKQVIIDGNRKATFMSNIGLENESITRDLHVLDKKMPYFTIALIR